MKMLSPALKRIVIASTPEAISQVRVCILDEASALGFAESDLLDLALGLEEALANALEHGNGRDRSKRIFVHYRVTPDQAVVEIEDEGNGFDPQSVADPTLNDNLHRIRGRGIFLMRALLDGVSYRAGGSLSGSSSAIHHSQPPRATPWIAGISVGKHRPRRLPKGALRRRQTLNWTNS